MLFGDHIRSNGSPLTYGESPFVFLDRVEGGLWQRTRELLTVWVEDYPQPDRTELVGRLRSKSPKDFGSAYWELLLFSLFRRCGFAVELHPVVPGSSRRPDFLIARDGQRTYVEARVLGEPAQFSKDASFNDYLRHELNTRVTSERYWIGFHVRRTGSEPPVKRLATALQSWLSTGPDIHGRWTWADEPSGTEIEFDVCHISARPRRGPFVGTSSLAYFFDDRADIRVALKDKAYAYGSSLDVPFVIALSLTDGFVKRRDVFQALFGDGADELQSQGNGFWQGTQGPRAQRVSGVLVGRSAQPWLLGRTDLELWTNPQATHLIKDFPDEIPVSGPTSGLLDERSHTSILPIFGLSADWQDEDPFAEWHTDH